MAISLYGQATQQTLADYFIQRHNLIGRDAEYTKNRWTLSQIPRDSKELARQVTLKRTLKVGNGWSGSPDWVKGNRNYTPSKTMRWSVDDPFAKYAKVSFDSLSLARGQADLGALIDLKSGEVDGVKSNMLDTLEFELWNDGTAARGQATAVSGTTTVTATLSNVSDVYNFAHGMVVTSNTARDGSGTAHTNEYVVASFDPLAGTLTLTRTVDNTSPIANNDFIHVVGSAGNYMPGIPQFIPAVAPADTLMGVARSADPVTSGWRFPFRSSIGETIQFAFATMGRWVNRAQGKFCVAISTGDWLLLSLEREGSRIIIENPSGMHKWGTNALTVRTPAGDIDVIAVPQLADGRAYIIDFSSWMLYTLKNLPHIVDEDGLTFVRGGTGTPDGHSQGDLLQLQLRMWTVLLCEQPLSNGTFPTA